MPMLREADRQTLKSLFAEKLTGPVKLVLYTQRQSPIWVPGMPVCEFCEQTERLVREVAELSDQLALEIYDFVQEEAGARAQGIDKIPALVLVGARDYGVRFYGIPSGYEFGALVEAIIDVSRGATDLKPRLKEELARLDRDVHIQVFTTPTCPYCPRAVRVAHQMAVESEHVRADAVEITEFPQLASRYQVRGVPKVVLNDASGFEGAVPADVFVAHVLRAAGIGGE
jgi:glutaredoxin-like protein